MIFRIIFILSSVLFSLAIVAMLIQLIFPAFFNISNVLSTSFLLGTIFFIALFTVLFAIVKSIFRDMASGESPFTLEQAKRLRTIAIILFIQVLLEMVLSSGIVSILVSPDLSVGYWIGDSGVNSSVLTLNVGAFITASIFFAVSFVFEYGVLLQDESDEFA